MECPYCKKEMEQETNTVDQFNPFQGHTQYDEEILYCEECDHVEPYMREEEYEHDMDLNFI